MNRVFFVGKHSFYTIFLNKALLGCYEETESPLCVLRPPAKLPEDSFVPKRAFLNFPGLCEPCHYMGGLIASGLSY